MKSRLGMSFLLFVVLLRPVRGQTVHQIEGFEFATSDGAAEAGVTDISSPSNRPTFFISGNDPDERSEGLYSIGTDALFGAGGKFVPGSVIGFRRQISTSLFPAGVVELANSYGDPEVPGAAPADKPLSDLQIIGDFYGRGAFAEGPTGTHLWINLIDAEGEVFSFINYSEESLYLEVFTLDVLVGVDVARISPQSLIDIPDGDRLLTEIVAFEVILQDDDDPPTGEGKWYIDDLRIGEFVTASLIQSDPPVDTTLWREGMNEVALSFSLDVSPPLPGQVGIQELLTGGKVGPDLGPDFSFAVELDPSDQPRILRITDDGAPDLQHGTWYSIRNVGDWPGVAPFAVNYLVQIGDADNDGRVLNADVSLIHTGEAGTVEPIDRRDINGDGVVDDLDVQATNARIPSFRVPLPKGH